MLILVVILVALGAVLAASGLGQLNPRSPATVIAAVAPTIGPLPVGEPRDCAGASLRGPLLLKGRLLPGQGSPTAEAFGVTETGLELTTYWPPGYQAVFDPGFSRILTSNGDVFAVAGEDINHDEIWRGHVICFTSRADLPARGAIAIWPVDAGVSPS